MSRKVCVLVRETRGRNVRRYREVDLVTELQNCEIVVEGSSVVLRMNVDTDHIEFFVRINLDVVVDIPLW